MLVPKNPALRSILAAMLLFLAITPIAPGWADEPDPAGSSDGREQLARLNPLIGGWRGVGQPLRGSSKGAWSETAEWVWNLKGKQPAIEYVVAEGKLLKKAVLTWKADDRCYQLTATMADGSERIYVGNWNKERLELLANVDGKPRYQVVVTPLNEKRTLVLFGEKSAGSDDYRRIAEVGYTRAGTRLAVEGAGEPECIVTGGKGTSTVTHKGKTYYVCCSGCRDAFLDDPEGIIAEAAEREKKKAEKEKAALK